MKRIIFCLKRKVEKSAGQVQISNNVIALNNEKVTWVLFDDKIELFLFAMLIICITALIVCLTILYNNLHVINEMLGIS